MRKRRHSSTDRIIPTAKVHSPRYSCWKESKSNKPNSSVKCLSIHMTDQESSLAEMVPLRKRRKLDFQKESPSLRITRNSTMNTNCASPVQNSKTCELVEQVAKKWNPVAENSTLTTTPVTGKIPKPLPENATPNLLQYTDNANNSGKRGRGRPRLSTTTNEVKTASPFKLRKELNTPFTSCKTRSKSSTPLAVETVQFITRSRSKSIPKSTELNTAISSPSVVTTPTMKRQGLKTTKSVRKSLDFEDKTELLVAKPKGVTQRHSACSNILEPVESKGNVGLHTRTYSMPHEIDTSNTAHGPIVPQKSTQSLKCHKHGMIKEHKTDGVRFKDRNKSGGKNSAQFSLGSREQGSAADIGDTPVVFSELKEVHSCLTQTVSCSTNTNCLVKNSDKDECKSLKKTIPHRAGNTNYLSVITPDKGDTVNIIQKTQVSKVLSTSPRSRKGPGRVTRHSLTPCKVKSDSTPVCLGDTKSPATLKATVPLREGKRIRENNITRKHMTTPARNVDTCGKQNNHGAIKWNTENNTDLQQSESTRVPCSSPLNLTERFKDERKVPMATCDEGRDRLQSNSVNTTDVHVAQKNLHGELCYAKDAIELSQDTVIPPAQETSQQRGVLNKTKSNFDKRHESDSKLTLDDDKNTVPHLKYAPYNDIDRPKVSGTLMQGHSHQRETCDNSLSAICVSATIPNSLRIEMKTANNCRREKNLCVSGSAKKQTKLMPRKPAKVKYNKSSKLISLIPASKMGTVSTRSSVSLPTSALLEQKTDEHINDPKDLYRMKRVNESKEEIFTRAEDELLLSTSKEGEGKRLENIQRAVFSRDKSDKPKAGDTRTKDIIETANIRKSKCREIYSSETKPIRPDNEEIITSNYESNGNDHSSAAKEINYDVQAVGSNKLTTPVICRKRNQALAIEKEIQNQRNSTDNTAIVDSNSGENTDANKQSCRREIHQTEICRKDNMLLEKIDTNDVFPIATIDCDNNDTTNTARDAAMVHHAQASVVTETHQSLCTVSTNNTDPVDMKYLEKAITEKSAFERGVNSYNKIALQGEYLEETIASSGAFSSDTYPDDSNSSGVSSNTAIHKTEEMSSEELIVIQPMACGNFPTDSDRTDSKEILERQKMTVAVEQKVVSVVKDEPCTPPQQIKGEGFTPKRSSRLQGRSNSSTPKRFEDYFIPIKRKKTSLKMEKHFIKSINGVKKITDHFPLKSKDQERKVKHVTITYSTDTTEILTMESAELKKIPKKEVMFDKTGKHKSSEDYIKPVEDNTMIDQKDITDNKTNPNQFDQREMTVEMDTPSIERLAHSKVSREKRHNIDSSAAQRLGNTREKKKKDKLRLKKIRNLTQVKLKGNWNDPLISETVELKTSTQPKATVSEKKEGSMIFSTVTVQHPLKMRIQRTSQSLAIASLHVSKYLEEASGPSTSKILNKKQSKIKGNASRQTKSKRPKSAPRNIINVDDLMKNEELSVHAFTLWKSDKGREIQRLHLGKSGELEKVLREAWTSLPQDEHKKYFLRVLSALTDENKHSPGRLLSGAPAGLAECETIAGPSSGRTKTQEVEIQTALDRKLTLFRQMSIAKQHNLLRQNFTCVQRMLSKEKYARFSLSVKQALQSLRSGKDSNAADNDDLEQESRDLMFLEVLKQRDLIREENQRAEAEAAVAVRRQFEYFIGRLISGESVPFDPGFRCQELRQALVDLQDLEKKSRVSVSGDVLNSKSFESLAHDIQTSGDNICEGQIKADFSGGGDGHVFPACNLTQLTCLQELSPVAEDSSFVEKLLEENAQGDLKLLDSEVLEDFLGGSQLDRKQVPGQFQASDEMVVSSVLEDAVSAIDALTHGLPCCDLNSPSCILSALLVLEQLTGSKPQ